MKKLLIMASLFWPQKKSGGPPVSIMNLIGSINGHFDISVISKNHEIGESAPLLGIQNGWNTFDFGKAYYVPKGEHSFGNIYRLIDEIAPDVIYQNSFFSYDDLLPVVWYKRRHPEVKVIVAPRGEFYPERLHCGVVKKKLYSAAMRLSGLLKGVCFQGTGEEECGQIQSLLHVPAENILNIQNIALVHSPETTGPEKKSGQLRLTYIARIHPTKNTKKAIEWLAEAQGQIAYDIYGPIEDAQYWQQCQTVIDTLPENVQVHYKGMVDHDKVAEVIGGYHGYYMPTTGENFGHSIVEAMLLGRPVVISDQTPWTDVNGAGGYAFPLNSKAPFIAALNQLCAMDQQDYDQQSDQIRAYIAQKLDIAGTVQAYIQAFEEI